MQVVDDTGEEIPIPGQDFGFGRLISAQAEGDYRVAARARPPHRAGQIGGSVDAARNDRPRAHGRGHDGAARASAGHEVQTYDPNVDARTAGSLEELKEQLEAPRAFWMMIPAGKITEQTFQQLLELADEGDTIVDGGNSNFRDSKRRYVEAQAAQASTSSTPASPAASGASRSASA